MLKKNLAKSIYHAYNISNKRRLDHFYSEVKKANENQVISGDSLEVYLSRWGFNTELEKNPLMDKETVKAWNRKVNIKEVHSWASTGGSYGEPLRIPYSRTRSLVRTASFRYFNELGGYDLGDSFALIRAKDKSPLIKFLRNETIIIPHDTSVEKIGYLLKKIKRKRVKVLMGYPSVLFEMALYLQQNPSAIKNLSVRNLISVSEPIESFKRKIIRDVFDCGFVDRYSNEEVGMIAQEKSFGEEYLINRYGLIVEVVNPETLLQVDEGQQGKVLVTDICNDLIPVIRYDTGDLAVAHKYKNNRLIAIKNITGRVTEQIFSPEGKPISPLILGPYIYKPLSKESRLFPYQFVQISRSIYELRLKAHQTEITDYISGRLLDGLKEVLGKQAEVSIRFVEEIKSLSSGKRPIFKNEMKIDERSIINHSPEKKSKPET
jgi:phenylacetate-CoA ligase